MKIMRKWRSSVARRIHFSLMLSAGLPLLILAVSAYQLVTHRLVAQALDDAHHLSKEFGMSVYDRLKFIADGLELVGRQYPDPGAPLPDFTGLDLRERVQGFFRVGADRRIRGASALSASDRDAIEGRIAAADRSLPLLLALGDSGRQRLFMLVPAGPAGHRHWIGAELLMTHLWDTVGVAERAEFVCVLGAQAVPVYCNHAPFEEWLRASGDMIRARSRPAVVPHDGGETAMTAVWSLFLKPHYQYERWTVLVGVPQALALDSVKSFGRVFAGVALIGLIIAFLLGRRMVRGNLGPLAALSDATRRLAAGDFQSRLRMKSGDEFQVLGEAFDSMAEQIGSQVAELEMLSQVDRNLQKADTIKAALTAASQGLAGLLGEGRSAVVCHEQWGDADTVWCRGFDAADVAMHSFPRNALQSIEVSPGGLRVRPDDYAYCRYCDAGSEAYLQVFRVLQSEFAVADILIRQAQPADVRFVGRIGDVLAISLENLVLERRLFHQANHDSVSGLPNRSRLHDLFDEWSIGDNRGQAVIGMLMLALDRFKQVNDSLGHGAGDRLLRLAGQRLLAVLPPDCVLARFAGDQYVLMLRGSDHQATAERLARLGERLGRELDRPLDLGMRDVRLSATQGAALYPRDGTNFGELTQALDAAAYAAKSSRRGGLLFFSSGMRAKLTGKLEIEQALKGAVVNSELVLHYQPVVDALTGRVHAAEALMRWQRPGVGLIMPGGFIELAEESGLIGEMGNWAIREVCRQLASWSGKGYALETATVNVSSVQLASDDILEHVREAIQDSGIPPGILTLEVTETALIGQFDEGVERLKRLRELGVKILIDDFGTGYASLKYLKMLPVDGLKIDRLFVKDLPDSVADEAIVEAVVRLARKSGYKIVAEGIETDAQADYLRAAGVPYLQGFLFAKGLPADILESRLSEEMVSHSRVAGRA